MISQSDTAMTTSLPETLYKYTSCDSAIKILFNKSLKFSQPATFNDPFEFSFPKSIAEDPHRRVFFFWLSILNPDTAAKTKIVRDIYNDFKAQNPLRSRYSILKEILESPSFEQAINLSGGVDDAERRVRECRVLCLSERALNITMWAHYAEQHTGVVLGFNTANSLFKNTYPVSYRPNEITSEDIEKATDYASAAELYIFRTCFHKSSDWEKEEEWRLIDSSEEHTKHGFLKFEPQYLSEVYFGLRTDPAMMKILTSLAKEINPEVAIYRCDRSIDNFELKPSVIEPNTR